MDIRVEDCRYKSHLVHRIEALCNAQLVVMKDADWNDTHCCSTGSCHARLAGKTLISVSRLTSSGTSGPTPMCFRLRNKHERVIVYHIFCTQWFEVRVCMLIYVVNVHVNVADVM